MEDNMMINEIEDAVNVIEDIVPAKTSNFSNWKAVGAGAAGTLVLVGLVKLAVNAYSKKKAKKEDAKTDDDVCEDIEAEFEDMDDMDDDE